MQTDIAPLASTHSFARPTSHVWVFWAGIVASVVGAFLILAALAALPLPHLGRVALLVAAPMVWPVMLLDAMGIGIVDGGLRAASIEITAGAIVCLVGAVLLVRSAARR